MGYFYAKTQQFKGAIMIQELFSLRICPSCGKYQVFCLHNKESLLQNFEIKAEKLKK